MLGAVAEKSRQSAKWNRSLKKQTQLITPSKLLLLMMMMLMVVMLMELM